MFLQVVCKTHQNLVEISTRFTCANHVDVEITEVGRVQRECICQARSGDNLLANVAENHFHPAVFDLFYQHGQCFREVDSGSEKCRKLTSQDGQVTDVCFALQLETACSPATTCDGIDPLHLSDAQFFLAQLVAPIACRIGIDGALLVATTAVDGLVGVDRHLGSWLTSRRHPFG